LAFTQKLQKLEGEAKDNQERIDHWSTEHDKLRLEDIESVAFFRTPMATSDLYHDSDDDEEEEEEEPEEAGEEQVKKEGEVKSEVKAEPGVNKKSKDANELHIYHEDELMLLKPNQLLADVQLLDGACVIIRDTVH